MRIGEPCTLKVLQTQLQFNHTITVPITLGLNTSLSLILSLYWHVFTVLMLHWLLGDLPLFFLPPIASLRCHLQRLLSTPLKKHLGEVFSASFSPLDLQGLCGTLKTSDFDIYWSNWPVWKASNFSSQKKSSVYSSIDTQMRAFFLTGENRLVHACATYIFHCYNRRNRKLWFWTTRWRHEPLTTIGKITKEI